MLLQKEVHDDIRPFISCKKIVQSFSPIGVLPITKLAIRNKFKNAWLKPGFVKDISVFTKNAQPQFGFTEMNEHNFLSETALVKTSLPLTQFLSNTKQGFPLSL